MAWPTAISQWSDLINQSSAASGVPAPIIASVMQQESGGNPSAVGTQGEIGLGQFMPTTASSLGIDPHDNTQNVMGMGTLLAQNYKQYGSWTSALSAYNSGSPTASTGYANSVLSRAGQYGYDGTTGMGTAGAATGTTGTTGTASTSQGAGFYIIAIILILCLVAAGIFGLIKSA